MAPAALALALGLLVAAPARATTVAIVRPENPSPITAETLVRLEGELMSVGFETAIVDAPGASARGAGQRGAIEGSGAGDALDTVVSRWRVDAAVAVAADPAPGRVAVSVIDRATGRRLARQASVEPGIERSPPALAIRALELLRSSLLELDLAFPTPKRPKPPAPPPAIPDVRADALAPSEPAGFASDRHFALEVGGAVMTSVGGTGPALAPLVRLDWAPQPEWAVVLSAAGLGSRPTVRSTAGSIEVSRSSLLLGVSRRFRADRALRPRVSLAAGALRTTANGTAEAPNEGHHTARWSLLLEAGLGAELPLNDRFFLLAVGQVQLAEPYVTVQAADDTLATVGRPDLLLALSLGAWL